MFLAARAALVGGSTRRTVEPRSGSGAEPGRRESAESDAPPVSLAPQRLTEPNRLERNQMRSAASRSLRARSGTCPAASTHAQTATGSGWRASTNLWSAPTDPRVRKMQLAAIGKEKASKKAKLASADAVEAASAMASDASAASVARPAAAQSA